MALSNEQAHALSRKRGTSWVYETARFVLTPIAAVWYRFKVTGREDSLYRWLDRLQMPDQFKGVTFMRLAPDAKDDTKIDATVVVDPRRRLAEASIESPDARPAPRKAGE